MDSKSLGFFFLFLVISLFTRGQDLIVTEKGDSLNCLISSVESDGIYFKRNVNGKMERWYAKRDTLISFSRKYYATEYLKGKQNAANDFQKYRFGLMGGGSLQTGRNLSFSGMSAYLDKIQYGYHFGAEGTYFFTNNIGFGLRYSFFHIESFVKDVTLSVQTTDTTKTSITGDLQDKISVNFIGPEFILRINSPQNRVHYNTTFAFGLITYRNKSELKTPAKLSGASVGMSLAFGPEFKVGKNLGLGLELSLVMGSITRYKQVDGSTSSTISLRNRNAISLTRIDLTLGIKWYK